MKQNTSETGKQGEKKALDFLKKKKYTIVATNYRTKLGEIDIIATDNDQLVFVEVKTRSSDQFGTPAESITKSKIEKILKAALIYMKESKKQDQAYRIDAVEVYDGKVSHLKNITL